MIEFNKILQENFDKMCQTDYLFKSSIGSDKLWETYLKGFGEDPVYRDPNSSYHNCNNCRNFVNRYGNIIAFDNDLNMLTIWDGDNFPDEYKSSADACSKLLKSSKIADVFVETFEMLNSLPYEKAKKDQKVYRLGLEKNLKMYTHDEAIKFGVVQEGIVYTYTHMSLLIPRKFIGFGTESVDQLRAKTRDAYQLLKRAITDIPRDTIETVRELIAQRSLLDAESHSWSLDALTLIMDEMAKVEDSKKDIFMWVTAAKNPREASFRGLIRELCLEIIDPEVGLEKACINWNKRVDPANYMRAVAPITQKQINEAMKFVQENGYEESFKRRCATLEDIKACNTIYSNAGDGKVKTVSIFDGLKPGTPAKTNSYKLEGAEEVGINDFIGKVLPSSQKVEVLFQNRLKNNLVSLTTSENKDSKRIMLWQGNNFSWTYNGNLSGKSQIKAAVKNAGGFVDADFRFSIMWNDEDTPGIVDFDAHARDPRNNEIYYGTFKGRTCSTGGMLDVDMISPHTIGVENIFWKNLNSLVDGHYRFWVHNFSHSDNNGIKAEIAFLDQTWTFSVNHNVKEDIEFADITIKNKKIESIKVNDQYLTDGQGSSVTVWGIDTNKFYPVSLICPSPNYWDDKGVGNKQYFFMIPGCKAEGKIRAFHNDQLIPDLKNHRKVLDALGAKLTVDSTDNQLSGLGFDATVNDNLYVKVENDNKSKIYNVKF